MKTSTAIERFTWFTLGLCVLVVVWGAFVRATGSGAGCGQHWPMCNGEILPEMESFHTLVEYSHRISSGVVLIASTALFFWARRVFPIGNLSRKLVVWSFCFMLLEALIGAVLVLFRLVEADTSEVRIIVIACHLINSLMLLGALTLAAESMRQNAERFHSQKLLKNGWHLAALAGTLLVGITGAIAALGDTLYPSETLLHGFMEDFSSSAHLAVQLRVSHPILAILSSIAILIISVRTRANGLSLALGGTLRMLVLTQLAAGFINLYLLAPVWMQLVHLFLACCLWIVLCLFISEQYWEGAES